MLEVENQDVAKYWLLITYRGYWAQLQKIGIWGFGIQNIKKVEKIMDGDIGVVYLTADGGKYKSAIGGIVQFKGKIQKNEKITTLFDGLYPLRISTKVLQVVDPPIPFKSLIGNVSFVHRGKNWGRSLQGQPIKTILKEDYVLILKLIMK